MTSEHLLAPPPCPRLSWAPEPGCAARIARAVRSSIAERGWRATWGSCEGFRIDEHVSVWLDGYQDLDMSETFLLRVWTTLDTGDASVTVTEHLALLWEPSAPWTSWRGAPRLFFDAGDEWRDGGLHWWINVIAARRREVAAALPSLSPEHEALIAAHNAAVGAGEHAKARRLGLEP